MELKHNQAQVLNIAHRGAGSLAPENTLAAAQKALATGADMWELDVAMTADGHLLLIHDDTLERTSNMADLFPERKPWPVHLFRLAEIRRLDFGSWFVKTDPFGQIAAGMISSADLDSYVGEPAPTLEEALVFTRDHDWQVNVEIKDLRGTPGDAVVVAGVVRLIEQLNMTDRVLISSFNQNYLVRIKAIKPQLAIGVLVEEHEPDPVGLLRRLQAQAYHPPASVQPEEIANLRKRGVAVNVWTVNDEAYMSRLVEAGVSGIITDFPQRLKQVIGLI